MRIGIFSDVYRPQINGVVYVIDILRDSFEKMGHEVFIFAPRPLNYEEKDDHIIRFPAVRGLFYDDYLTSMFFQPAQLRKIKNMELDAVFCVSPSQIGLLGCAAAKKYDIPLVMQYSTDLFEYVALYPSVVPGVLALVGFAFFSRDISGGDMKMILKDIRERGETKFSQSLVKGALTALHNRCDAVIALSRKKQKELTEWETTSPIEMIPTGVDALGGSKATAVSLRKKYKIAPSDKVAMFVGRIAEEKNLKLLVDSFDLLKAREPRAKLVFVGDFEYRPKLEALAAETNNSDDIIFTGAIPREELGSYYKMADVFAFPSLTDTQGLVVHEAALAGLPLVLVDKEVSEVLIDGKTGFYADDNPESMAKALAKVFSLSADKYKKMSQAAQARAKEFSQLKQSKKILKLLEDLVQERK